MRRGRGRDGREADAWPAASIRRQQRLNPGVRPAAQRRRVQTIQLQGRGRPVIGPLDEPTAGRTELPGQIRFGEDPSDLQREEAAASEC